MEIVRLALLFLHLMGLAALLGGCFVQVKGPQRRITPAILYGALVLLVTGPSLMAVDAAIDHPANEIKAGVKLLVLLAITVLAFAFRKRASLAPGVFFTVFTLSLLNVGIAVFWT